MQRFGEWAYEQRMVILAAIGLVVVAAVVWAAMGMYRSQREDKGEEALFTAEKKLHVADEAFNPPNTPELPPGEKGTPPEKKAPVPRSGDVNVDYKDSLP